MYLFRKYFFSWTLDPEKELDSEIQIPILNIFKKNILKFVRPIANNKFVCQNVKVIKYSLRLRLGLSHLYKYKFKNNFQDKLNPLCSCCHNVGNTCRFLLDCPNFLAERITRLNKITNTAWKVSLFWVILVRIFPHSD